MAKKERLNEEAAPNNNMSYADIQRSSNYKFAEQRSDDSEVSQSIRVSHPRYTRQK
ncbi:hypothetical protein MHB50_00010 [Siminovitchia sp. FSL H7-0308]|uniref:hypothetical protein n=1 Tax=unclassified Siminovitchia TaxID=2837530 RepID=UPI0030D285A2